MLICNYSTKPPVVFVFSLCIYLWLWLKIKYEMWMNRKNQWMTTYSLYSNKVYHKLGRKKGCRFFFRITLKIGMKYGDEKSLPVWLTGFYIPIFPEKGRYNSSWHLYEDLLRKIFYSYFISWKLLFFINSSEHGFPPAKIGRQPTVKRKQNDEYFVDQSKVLFRKLLEFVEETKSKVIIQW